MIGAKKWLLVGLSAVWLLAGAVQYNDPDPLPWVTVYVVASLLILLAVKKPALWQLPAGMALGIAPWCIALGPQRVLEVPIDQFIGKIAMQNETVELAREAWGLLLVAMSLLVTAGLARRSRS